MVLDTLSGVAEFIVNAIGAITGKKKVVDDLYLTVVDEVSMFITKTATKKCLARAPTRVINIATTSVRSIIKLAKACTKLFHRRKKKFTELSIVM